MTTPPQPDPWSSRPDDAPAGAEPWRPTGSAWSPGDTAGSQDLPSWQPQAGSGWGPPPVGAGPVGAPQAGWGPAGYAAPGGTEAKAIVALVLAVGSFLVLPFVPAVVALFVAGAARRDIRASSGRLSGEGLVTASRIVAWANIVLCVLAVVALLLLFVVLGSVGFSEGGPVLESTG